MYLWTKKLFTESVVSVLKFNVIYWKNVDWILSNPYNALLWIGYNKYIISF